jgi:hypothetical protein
MAILLVLPTLTDFFKAEIQKDLADFTWFENGRFGHV